jgi:hypothetical protein
MSLTRFVGKSPEELAHMTPDAQLQVFSDKVKERNFSDAPREKLEMRNSLLVGSALGALAYLAHHLTQGNNHV